MKEIIRMNQLAGLITESQAKKMMAITDKKAALKNKHSLKENESSAYITIDPKFPNEVELYADSGDYASEIEKNGKVTFTLIFDEGDNEGTYMNSEDIFDDHAPAVFKKIVKAGGDFDAGDDYVEVTTTLDNLKKLFPMKESVKENKSSSNKYVTIEIDEDGEKYPRLNEKTVADYLKSVIDPKQKRAVDTFMNDDEGFGESSSHFFDDDGSTTTEKDVEDWATMEMSYYLYSSPDEFPFNIKESLKENYNKPSEKDVFDYWSIMVNNQPEDVIKILTDLNVGTLSYKDFLTSTTNDVFDSFKDELYDEEEDY